MKPVCLFLMGVALLSCVQQSDRTQALESRIDSLERKLADTYKPGFGEFMSSIQVHHNKLWFAGQNQNWKLADFEIHEIIEAIDDIQKYQTERKESQLVRMISPALDSVNNAVEHKDLALFRSSFISLTRACNNCHRDAHFEFNVVKIPDSPPFSNQDFRVGAKYFSIP